jgi:hypothetical protein
LMSRIFLSQRLVLLLLAIALGPISHGAVANGGGLTSPPPSIAHRYRPDSVGQIALSPDGRHLAHTVHAGSTISLVITDLEQPAKKATRLIGKNFATSFTVEETRGATILAGVTFLQWISSDRLVYAVSQANVRGIAVDEIWAVGSEGRDHRKLVDSEELGDYLPEPFNNESSETPTRRTKPQLVPRSFKVLGPRLADPNTIAVEVFPNPQLEPPNGAPQLETRSGLYTVNVRTGKFSGLSSERGLGRYLYDQQAHPRLREPAASWIRAGMDLNSSGVSSDLGGISTDAAAIFEPQKFRIRPVPDNRAWRDLDDLVARDLPHPLVFNTSVEKHYSPRSFPIGFDHDPNLLYFASDVGRNTFGLYALDLRTGRPTGFAVEDPLYDVVDPSEAFNDSILIFDRQRKLAGVFPALTCAFAGSTKVSPAYKANSKASFRSAMFRSQTGTTRGIASSCMSVRWMIRVVITSTISARPRDCGRFSGEPRSTRRSTSTTRRNLLSIPRAASTSPAS